MNDITNYQAQLPDTIEDLTQFVLIGRSKLNAYKLKLQKVDRLSDAQSIREQTLQDMQDVSIAIVAAEQRIGEILLSIQKSSGGDRKSENFKNRDSSNFEKTKNEVTSEMGYSKDQVSEYQRLAQNPEIVQKVIDDALTRGEVVTRRLVIEEIRSAKEEMKRQLAEKDKRISELEKQDPEVVEVIKEVIPDDYADLKEAVEMQRKEALFIQRERDSDRQKIKELNERIRDLESRKDLDDLKKKVQEETGYFAIRTYNYIQQNGGSVWIFDQLDLLSEKDREQFINAIYALDAFSKQMIENVGGYGIG